MSHTYKILEAEIEHDHVDKRDLLGVEIQIYLDGKKLDVRRFGFELDTPEKAVRAELDRVVACLDGEAAQAAKNAEHEKRQKTAKDTIKSLKDEAPKKKVRKSKGSKK